MQSRGYEPPAPQMIVSNRLKTAYDVRKLHNAKFASTSGRPAPPYLYLIFCKFSKKYVLKCEVPNSSPPHFDPIDNEGTEYPVAVTFQLDIVGIYEASSNTIKRIYDSDAKTQMTLNLKTRKAEPYSVVFG